MLEYSLWSLCQYLTTEMHEQQHYYSPKTEISMRAVVVVEELLDAAAGPWKATIKQQQQKSPPVSGKGVISLLRDRKSGHHRLSFAAKVKIAATISLWVFFFCLLFTFLHLDRQKSGEATTRIPSSGDPEPGSGSSGAGSEEVSALRGMGAMVNRGSGGAHMSELIVGHVTERVTAAELGTFVRALYRSGAMARADLVVIFPAREPELQETLRHEADLGVAAVLARNSSLSPAAAGSPVVVGSVMSFEMEELDPGNILGSFTDDPPAQMRRWACYNLLLGLLRHRYGSVMLARIGSVLVLGDVLAVTTGSDRSGLFLIEDGATWDAPASSDEFLGDPAAPAPARRTSVRRKPGGKHRRRAGIPARTLAEAVYGPETVMGWSISPEERHRQALLSSGLIFGSAGPVRSLCTAVLNEIVRVAVDRRSRRPFPDRVPLSYLVRVSSVLGRRVTDNLRFLRAGSGFPVLTVAAGARNETVAVALAASRPLAVDGIHRLHGRPRGGAASTWLHGYIRRQICAEAPVYPDCTEP